MTQDLKGFATEFYSRVFTKGDLDAIDEFVQPDAVDHNPLPGQAPGRDGMRQVIGMYMSAFDNIHMEIEDMLVEDDVVLSRLTFTATHTGEFMGAAPTENRVEITGFDEVRVRDGKIVERWGLVDVPSLLQQIGVELPLGS